MAETDIGEGPARLFHDTQSVFSFHLLYVLDLPEFHNFRLRCAGTIGRIL